MERFTVIEKNDSDIMFQFLDPTPADDAPARRFPSACWIPSDSLTPLTLDFGAQPQDLLKVFGGLHIRKMIRHVS
jgi:hypothetical protein